MKIHELNGDQLAEALCLIAEPIERITQDEEVSKTLADIGNKRKENTVFGKFIGYTYAKLIPLLLKKHKDSIFEILAVLTGKPVEEIHKQNGWVTVMELRKWLNEDVIRFFTSSEGTAAKE